MQSKIQNPKPFDYAQGKSKIHWPSLIQAILTTLAAIGLLGLACVVAVFALAQRLSGAVSISETTSDLLVAAALALAFVLLLPPLGYAMLRWLGKKAPGWRRLPSPLARIWVFGLVLIVFPAVWLLGTVVSTQEKLINFSWLLLPPLHVLAIGIPVLALLELGRGGLPSGSPQRAWGVFSSGLVIAPAVIMAIEIGALAVFGLIGLVYLAAHPDLAQELSRLAARLRFASPTPDELLGLLSPYLTRPAVVFSAFVFIAVLTPLIEEALKPVGVWLLAGRELTAAEGFAAGVLSGAGYALVENLGIPSSGEDWAVLVLVRACTAILHIYTAGLMGWALATAWGQKRYLRLGMTYLTAALIHGLWNGLTLFGAAAFLSPAITVPPVVGQRGVAAFAGVGVLVMAVFALLGLSNRVMRKTIM